jgi:hypothetical protein
VRDVVFAYTSKPSSSSGLIAGEPRSARPLVTCERTIARVDHAVPGADGIEVDAQTTRHLIASYQVCTFHLPSAEDATSSA